MEGVDAVGHVVGVHVLRRESLPDGLVEQLALDDVAAHGAVPSVLLIRRDPSPRTRRIRILLLRGEGARQNPAAHPVEAEFALHGVFDFGVLEVCGTHFDWGLRIDLRDLISDPVHLLGVVHVISVALVPRPIQLILRPPLPRIKYLFL